MDEGLRALFHGEGIKGQRSAVGILPDEDLGVVIGEGAERDDEDDHRRLSGIELFEHLEGIELGHLDVEDGELGTQNHNYLREFTPASPPFVPSIPYFVPEA